MKKSIILALMALTTVSASAQKEADHRIAFMVKQCEIVGIWYYPVPV